MNKIAIVLGGLLPGVLCTTVGAAVALNCPSVSSGGSVSTDGSIFIIGQLAIGPASGGGISLNQGVMACWTCEGDANGDGAVDPLDTGFVLSRFDCPVGTGDPDCDAADVNANGAVDPLDVGYVLSRFGTCE